MLTMHLGDGVFDVGTPPPEPEKAPEPVAGPVETFREKALRRAKEAENEAAEFAKCWADFQKALKDSQAVLPLFWFDLLIEDWHQTEGQS